MNEPQRVLIVDDELQITRVLRRGLANDGYEVQVAHRGDQALAVFEHWSPNLVITDLTMPTMGGLELCRRLRTISSAPIIILSATGEERIRVEALDSGADDYLTKPFGMKELLARVRAVLRRPEMNAFPETKVIDAGDFRIDLDARRVRVRGQEVHLTPKEYELLIHFIRHAGKVLHHRDLLSAVWGVEFAEQNEYLRVLVGHLRRKIEPAPTSPHYIHTEPWVGYRFENHA